MESAVRKVTMLAMVMRRRPWMMPAWPMTQVSLRKSMTPQMLRRHGISTPSFHVNLVAEAAAATLPVIIQFVLAFAWKKFMGLINISNNFLFLSKNIKFYHLSSFLNCFHCFVCCSWLVMAHGSVIVARVLINTAEEIMKIRDVRDVIQTLDWLNKSWDIFII